MLPALPVIRFAKINPSSEASSINASRCCFDGSSHTVDWSIGALTHMSAGTWEHPHELQGRCKKCAINGSTETWTVSVGGTHHVSTKQPWAPCRVSSAAETSLEPLPPNFLSFPTPQSWAPLHPMLSDPGPFDVTGSSTTGRVVRAWQTDFSTSNNSPALVPGLILLSSTTNYRFLYQFGGLSECDRVPLIRF